MTGYEILGYEKINGTDEEKVNEIVESIKENGWNGAPILTYGNVLITGSHRLAALEKLYDEDFNIGFECAVDVTDIIEEKINDGEYTIEDVFDSLDDISFLFEGTWVEEYKDEIVEW